MTSEKMEPASAPGRKRLKALPEELVNRIAAGEVVERPASILKELFENALDAGATRVTISLKEGGVEGIQITDNGEGMAAEDLPLAIERHTTSKIDTFEDLYNLKSYGFRGEALPSIAAVANLEIITRRREDLWGTRMAVKFGRIEEIAAVGAPLGTTVRVEDIFANLPVRKKFLKSRATELKHCLEVAERLAVPQVGLEATLSVDGREVLHLPRTDNLWERIAFTAPVEAAKSLWPIAECREGMHLEGFVAPYSLGPRSSKQLRFYVNNRPVQDSLLRQAVMTAVKGKTEKYPWVYLFLSLPPGEVDVNVHPAKMEVRFRRPKDVFELVVSSLGMAWGRSLTQPRSFGGVDGKGGERDQVPILAEPPKRYRIISPPVRTGGEKKETEATFAGTLPFAEEEPAISLTEEWKESDWEFWGQYGTAFLIFASPAGIMIIDQHAAHERIIYEELKKREQEQKPLLKETLLFPETVPLTPADYAQFLFLKELLGESGFEIEPFGGGTVLVRAVPYFFAQGKAADILRDIIAEFPERETLEPMLKIKDRLWRSLACRGSVMAGTGVDGHSARDLLRRLAVTPHKETCPHGRPVWIMITEGDLARMFKRK